jgi:iron complex outermembrane receptor protein
MCAIELLRGSAQNRVNRVDGARRLALVATLLLPCVGLAQTAPAAESEDLLQEVVVTGTHLGQSGFATPTPVTVVGEVEMQRQAISNIAGLLNTLPAFRPQSTPATTSIFINNAGANLADLICSKKSEWRKGCDHRTHVSG